MHIKCTRGTHCDRRWHATTRRRADGNCTIEYLCEEEIVPCITAYVYKYMHVITCASHDIVNYRSGIVDYISHLTPHTLPLWTSYGAYTVSHIKRNHHIVT